VLCPSCGRENVEGVRFCGYCGASLAGASHAEERRVVTVLFCDLVGFTSSSDNADPEDVRARLVPFHTTVKREIEVHGGTLDKFIGDAALGVFGWPIGHEDDPERAVRAALAIQEAIEDVNRRDPGLELQVHQGLATGEAVLAGGAGPMVGESVIGDTVNTAARLESAASPGTILVADSTYELTNAAVVYEGVPPVVAKGKSQPLRAWRPLAIRSRPLISERPAGTPFVGRSDELQGLRRAFEEAIARSGLAVTTIVGEPGVGKSRLLAEFRTSLESAGRGPRWLRGRCLPYGEGVTYWPLVEIVSALAGIEEADPPERRADLVDTLMASLAADPAERPWLSARVLPLVGAGGETPVEREESFTAWTRLLEHVARRGPTVVVVEDVHWAEPGLVAFLDHLVAGPPAAPILLALTARPEFEGLAPAREGETRLALGPLPETEAAQLLDGLLDRLDVDAGDDEVRSRLLEQAGGNPLFAQELAHAVLEQGSAPDPALPPSLQALIGARLDTLPSAHRELLLNASVIGRVFWAAAVAFLTGADQDTVPPALGTLESKEFVRRQAPSGLPGELEYVFWHDLIREVAYARMPRAVRAERHRSVIAWIEQTDGDRLPDRAEKLASHATKALELARAARSDEVPELATIASRYLRMAAGRSMALDVSRAEEQFASALSLLAEDDLERPRVLTGMAEAAFHAGRLAEADERYREAIDALQAQAATLEAGDAMVRRSVVLEYRGETTEGRALLTRAIGLLEGLAPSRELARALATAAGSALVSGRYEAAVVEAGRAVEVAEWVGEPVAAARARAFRGYAHALRGNADGLDEQRAAVRALLELGQGRATAIAYLNLGSSLGHTEGPEAALDLFREAFSFARTRGLEEMALAVEDGMMTMLYELGRWDELLELGERVVDGARRQGSTYDEVFADADRAVVRACREGAEARAFCEDVLARARPLQDQPLQLWALVAVGLARATAGELGAARDAVVEARDLTRADPLVRAAEVPHLVRLAVETGDSALAVDLLDGLQDVALPRYRLSVQAARAVIDEVEGDAQKAGAAFLAAERRWERWGHVLEAGQAALGAARCFLRSGQAEEAAAARDRAERRFEQLGAAPLLVEVHRLAGREAEDEGGRV
jgi:class 3 adenylate cyclase/tetratricopeptide (TPR) repeat protein